MKTKNPTPEQMTMISNIQAMWTRIGIYHDTNDFYNLCTLSNDQLWEKQNALIPFYNESLKNNPHENN